MIQSVKVLKYMFFSGTLGFLSCCSVLHSLSSQNLPPWPNCNRWCKIRDSLHTTHGMGLYHRQSLHNIAILKLVQLFTVCFLCVFVSCRYQEVHKKPVWVMKWPLLYSHIDQYCRFGHWGIPSICLACELVIQQHKLNANILASLGTYRLFSSSFSAVRSNDTCL